MQKIIVIGCPGSGKSTFSKALHARTGIPLVHLDNLYWNADKTTVDRAVFLERLDTALAGDRWIIDGNYLSTMERRLDACDTVILLDYPTDVCLAGIRERRGTARTDMPWVETEEDTELTDFVKHYATHTRPQVAELLQKYVHKSIFTFTKREETDTFLINLQHGDIASGKE